MVGMIGDDLVVRKELLKSASMHGIDSPADVLWKKKIVK